MANIKIKAVIFPRGSTVLECPYCEGKMPVPDPMEDVCRCLHCKHYFVLAEYRLGLWHSFLRRAARALNKLF